MNPRNQIDSQWSLLKWKKLSREFSMYTTIGIIFTLAYVFLIWLCIDILKLNTLIASSAVVVGLHVAKFISYRDIRLIHNQFFKYTSIQVCSGLMNIGALWFMVGMLHLPAAFSSIMIISTLFLLRFLLFKITGLTLD